MSNMTQQWYKEMHQAKPEIDTKNYVEDNPKLNQTLIFQTSQAEIFNEFLKFLIPLFP